MDSDTKNKVIEFAQTLNAEQKRGWVNSFVVIETKYRTDASTKENLKESEIKYEVKCREKWTWLEFIATMPYITVIVIAIGMMVTLSRGCASDNACNISTTIKAVLDQR